MLHFGRSGCAPNRNICGARMCRRKQRNDRQLGRKARLLSRHCSRLRLGSEKFCAMRPRGRGQLAGQVGGAGEGKPGTEGRRRAFWRFLTTAIQAGDCYPPREEGFLGAEGGKERRFDMVTASFTQLGWLVLSNLHCCRGRACMLHMSG